MAHMVCIYGPAEEARKLVARITKMHSKVKGTSAEGNDYFAMDSELLDWVHATTCYGFSEAYNLYVSPLTDAEIDQSYREREALAKLFRSTNPPLSKAQFFEQLEGLKPGFCASPIIEEYLKISLSSSPLPKPLNLLKKMIVKAAIDLLPRDVRQTMNIGPEFDLKGWERRVLCFVGARLDKKCLPAAAPAQSCVRMGLPEDYLYK